MSQTISDRAKQALCKLDGTVDSYARGRNPEWAIGQFLDAEGRLSEQFGIFGMGSWIALTGRPELRELPGVRKLRDNCKEVLKQWVEGSGRIRGASPDQTDDKNIRYLKHVVPKICYAYQGLKYYQDAGDAANTLLGRILQSQDAADGCWAFIVGSNSKSAEATALVVRTFGADQAFSKSLHNVRSYLNKAWKEMGNPYLKLYVLNTLWKFGDNNDKKDLDREVKAIIIKLLNQAFYNPTQFPNPINIDYNDGNETRYMRLSGDLILLESLANISGNKNYYLRGHPGHRILNHLLQILRTPPTKDTTGHRLALPTALHIQQTLIALTESNDSPRLLSKAWSYVVSAFTFGVNVSSNAVILGLSLAGLLLSFYFKSTVCKSIFGGVLAKSVFDMIKSLWNFRRFVGD